jgi:hypothetical protein
VQRRAMPIATISSLIGAILLIVSLVQTVPFAWRWACVVGMIICEALFIWAFMLLGAKG